MEYWLPVIFVSVMGLALFIYVILDGFDLGIGMLMPLANNQEKDIMISSIGPFWDANETWIVLGVGVLLIAFPAAHGIILTSLYLPATLMLMGLVLRGIAFDFRVKANSQKKPMWNFIFFAGSLIASACQGWMLGAYITGLQTTLINILFSGLIALTLPALYIMLGAAWLLIKTEGELFEKSLGWAKNAIIPMGLAFLLLSIATPLISQSIAEKWFSFPNFIFLLPIPLLSLAGFGTILFLLKNPESLFKGKEWRLYLCLISLCLLAAIGLAYSIFPDIIIGQVTIFEASADTASLLFTFWGVAITFPFIIIYTIFVYRIFHGKTTQLSYE